METKPLFSSVPAHRLVTVMTELFWTPIANVMAIQVTGSNKEDGVWIQATSLSCAYVITGCFKRNHAVKPAAKKFF
jgi:hypothetical protein